MVSKAKFSVIDIETTSLDVKKAEILSVAILPMIGTKILIGDYYFTFIRPKKMNAESIKIHGIDTKTIKNAPRFEDVMNIIFKKIENSIIVGCDVGFDIEILKKYFKNKKPRFKPEWIDIIQLEKFLIKRNNIKRDINTFEDLLRIYNLDDSYRHSALADAYQSAHIFQLQLKRIISYGISVDELLSIGKRKHEFVPYYIG